MYIINNAHIIIGFKTFIFNFLIKNEDEDIYKNAINNIKNN